MPLLVQLMRGAKTNADKIPDPSPVVILDLKGDAALFHTVKEEARQRRQDFQFFTTEKNAATYRFNPFRGFDRSSRTVAQLCQLILDALSLNHGKGYGRSYYTERSRNILSLSLKRHQNITSFDDLHKALKTTLSGMTDSRAKNDAFELLSVIEMLTEYGSSSPALRRMCRTRTESSSCHAFSQNARSPIFWLPAALESISVGEIAKLVLFNLRIAAQDWKRGHPDSPRRVILVIDELQRVAGENLSGILQDARSFGISAILANQSLKDLRSPTGFDLAPTIMTNTRAKFSFTSPSEHEAYVFVERGKGFTESRQYPALGNPWLRELAPEEFGYNVSLAWPFPAEEYKARGAKPLPSWAEIPGGDYWVDKQPLPAAAPTDIEDEDHALPHAFQFIEDDERVTQMKAIEALFSDAEPAASDDDTDPLSRFPGIAY